MTAARALPVLAPSDRFVCETYSCTLTARVCLLRQTTVRGGRGSSHGKGFTKRYVEPHLKFCASGSCDQGKAIAEALRGQQIERPRDLDIHAQQRARRRVLGDGGLLLAPELRPVAANRSEVG